MKLVDSSIVASQQLIERELGLQKSAVVMAWSANCSEEGRQYGKRDGHRDQGRSTTNQSLHGQASFGPFDRQNTRSSRQFVETS
ncbi:hypothetical protein [Nevskia ramosa]|uniref:hypothetical protein n=1 Tax=Nevskia ramosa TaxID=64002 RepID=UPI002357E4BB|nr:hypothetical protein [Nevskia ramosa]